MIQHEFGEEIQKIMKNAVSIFESIINGVSVYLASALLFALVCSVAFPVVDLASISDSSSSSTGDGIFFACNAPSYGLIHLTLWVVKISRVG